MSLITNIDYIDILLKSVIFMNYSQIIKALRLELGYSQKEMASFLGVSFATLNRWENGHFNPTFKHKAKIVEFCRDFRIF